MIEIIPAIMPKSFDDLHEDMSLVTGFVPMVQIDVMDGVFVQNKSWPYMQKNGAAQNAGASPDPDFDEIIKEEAAFPYWEELDFEADLMVANPIDVAQDWITAGAKRLIIHIESFKTPADAVMAFQQLKKQLPIKDSFLYTEIGVALNPSTPNEAIEPLMEYVDFVQFMGIEKIGYQGQPFDERVIEKISSLRAARPNVTISVDGSVNIETAPRLIAAGANRLAIGSAIFESEDIAVTIEKFFALAGREGGEEN
jgi:ribulose-phosphate 3-epimerase